MCPAPGIQFIKEPASNALPLIRLLNRQIVQVHFIGLRIYRWKQVGCKTPDNDIVYHGYKEAGMCLGKDTF